MAKRGRKPLPPGSTQQDRAELKKLPVSYGEALTVYASGNGALSFVWLHTENGQRVATGRPVTMDDARAFLASDPEGTKLTKGGWKLWAHGPLPTLIADVERTGENTLRMGDAEYTYHIDQADFFYQQDKEVRQSSLTLTYLLTIPECDINEVAKVKNLGSLASAAFFLTHEQAIKASPPEHPAMTIPAPESVTSGDQARNLAIEWQHWQSGRAMSYDDMAKWHEFFTELAQRFGLTEEFTENGII